SRSRHTSCLSDWSSDVCSSDLAVWSGPAIFGGWQDEADAPSGDGRRCVGGFEEGQYRPHQRDAVDLEFPGFAVWDPGARAPELRSEERRVGKEGRCQLTTDRYQ